MANVGDSLVYVETNDRGMEMVGADHRLNSNETEVNRLKNCESMPQFCFLLSLG